MPVRTPSETLELACNAGVAKAALGGSRRFYRLALGSALAGAYIALGGALSIVVGFGCPEITATNPGIQRLLSGLVFPIGLMLVVILGADLFTGNNALLIPPALRGKISWSRVLGNWTFVWLGNFVGALAVAWFLIYLAGVFAAPSYTTAVCNIAVTKASLGFWPIFLKGIGANWCVCLAVWLALSGRRLGEKLLACEIPVLAFVALGFEHCVANMFFIPLGMMYGADLSVADLFANLIPATLGNIAGGALFVGLSQHYLYNEK